MATCLIDENRPELVWGLWKKKKTWKNRARHEVWGLFMLANKENIVIFLCIFNNIGHNWYESCPNERHIAK